MSRKSSGWNCMDILILRAFLFYSDALVQLYAETDFRLPLFQSWLFDVPTIPSSLNQDDIGFSKSRAMKKFRKAFARSPKSETKDNKTAVAAPKVDQAGGAPPFVANAADTQNLVAQDQRTDDATQTPGSGISPLNSHSAAASQTLPSDSNLKSGQPLDVDNESIKGSNVPHPQMNGSFST